MDDKERNPEGVGLFSERDWQSSPCVSWELLVKLDSALSTTIKAVPTCSSQGSCASWSKTTATFLCWLLLILTMAPAPKSGVCPRAGPATKGWGWQHQPGRINSSIKQLSAHSSASPWAPDQAPVLGDNCLNNSHKSCLSEDLSAFLH